jgi:hypothetical protein
VPLPAQRPRAPGPRRPPCPVPSRPGAGLRRSDPGSSRGGVRRDCSLPADAQPPRPDARPRRGRSSAAGRRLGRAAPWRIGGATARWRRVRSSGPSNRSRTRWPRPPCRDYRPGRYSGCPPLWPAGPSARRGACRPRPKPGALRARCRSPRPDPAGGRSRGQDLPGRDRRRPAQTLPRPSGAIVSVPAQPPWLPAHPRSRPCGADPRPDAGASPRWGRRWLSARRPCDTSRWRRRGCSATFPCGRSGCWPWPRSWGRRPRRPEHRQRGRGTDRPEVRRHDPPAGQAGRLPPDIWRPSRGEAVAACRRGATGCRARPATRLG